MTNDDRAHDPRSLSRTTSSPSPGSRPRARSRSRDVPSSCTMCRAFALAAKLPLLNELKCVDPRSGSPTRMYDPSSSRSVCVLLVESSLRGASAAPAGDANSDGTPVGATCAHGARSPRSHGHVGSFRVWLKPSSERRSVFPLSYRCENEQSLSCMPIRSPEPDSPPAQVS